MSPAGLHPVPIGSGCRVGTAQGVPARDLSPKSKASIMKIIPAFSGAVLGLLLAGCASPPIVLSPIGPNPAGFAGPDLHGRLEVYSARMEQDEGDNPIWYQHADYNLYDSQGKKLRHVGNTEGHYDEAPRTLTLPAGRYVVKAPAKDYLWVEVPVVIEPGRVTRVHLDDRWEPPPSTSTKQLVILPASHPVGWRAETKVTS